METKNDLIKELKIELENLDIKNKELYEIKNKLKAEFNKNEKSNKHLINIKNSSNNNKINNKYQFLHNINNSNNLRMKRNHSAAITKRKIDKESINELKKINEELYNKLLLYKNELNNLINNVNDKEINCKLLMFNAKNYAKYYSQ